MSSQTIFITKGQTNVTVDVHLIQDSGAANPGDPLTGLVFNSAGLTCYFRESDTNSVTQLTLASLALVSTAHTDGGFIELDATNMPGHYRLDLSDAIVSGGPDRATVVLNGAADLATHTIFIELFDVDLRDPVRAGLTSLPNAAAEAAGGLYTRGTGAGQINQQTNGQIDSNVERWLNGVVNALVSGRVDGSVGAMATDTISSAALSANAITDIWAKVVESQGSYTAQQVMTILLSATAGVTSNGGATLETPDGVANRITATVNGSNERTAMTLTPGTGA